MEDPVPRKPKRNGQALQEARRSLSQAQRRVREVLPQDKGESRRNRERQAIWEEAAAFCVRQFPTLWTAGEPRRDQEMAGRWLVPIVLRYPDGHEGVLGEMVWDGRLQSFTVLTDRATLSKRAQHVASCRA
jgi:hypothetical protein